MKDLENKLFSMDVPKIEDDPFENKLRRKLVNRFYKPANNFRFKFKLVTALASLLLIFGCVIVIQPGVALSLNKLIFPSNIMVAERDNSGTENELAYTSIFNPQLVDRLDPSKFREDKTYIIRKYISAEEGAVMIVSEFDQRKKPKKLREVSF
ncbi:MAG: hypothetical protein ISS80_02925 [Candidatus Cloacimonetes bacterium]|nr:hypothetical protein [Candidatus Cloacimonadota bacterium]MBL7149005.1 hypothetical protein [Candidatus Cloacimonadota bacterium]